MAKTNHALVFDLNLTCKLKLEVKYYALDSAFNLTCKLNVAGFNQQVQVLFTSVRFSNVRKHRYNPRQVSGFIMQVQVLFTYVCPLNMDY